MPKVNKDGVYWTDRKKPSKKDILSGDQVIWTDRSAGIKKAKKPKGRM
jgi:hypothetical protein